MNKAELVKRANWHLRQAWQGSFKGVRQTLYIVAGASAAGNASDVAKLPVNPAEFVVFRYFHPVFL
jgi:hypothetical protein